MSIKSINLFEESKSATIVSIANCNTTTLFKQLVDDRFKDLDYKNIYSCFDILLLLGGDNTTSNLKEYKGFALVKVSDSDFSSASITLLRGDSCNKLDELEKFSEPIKELLTKMDFSAFCISVDNEFYEYRNETGHSIDDLYYNTNNKVVDKPKLKVAIRPLFAKEINLLFSFDSSNTAGFIENYDSNSSILESSFDLYMLSDYSAFKNRTIGCIYTLLDKNDSSSGTVYLRVDETFMKACIMKLKEYFYLLKMEGLKSVRVKLCDARKTFDNFDGSCIFNLETYTSVKLDDILSTM